MRNVTRRDFLKSSFAAGAGLALAAPFSKVRGANDDIRVGVVGIHGRGGSHISGFRDINGVRVVALCDVDRKVLDGRVNDFKKKNEKVDGYVDVREMLEDKSIDAISIATTNHTHSLITVWGCQAGKDVYVEKPCSHNVFEGRKCVEAARKYNRIVQHGTQQRSSGGRAREMATIWSGKYGKLLVSKGYCCKPRWSIGFKTPKAPPANLDFDLWLGPALEQDYHENLVHYNWHWFWDFGCGDIGNQGVHEMDVARWAIKGSTLPKSIVSLGGRWVNEPGFKDQGQTPNMQTSIYDYGDTLLLFETRGLVDKKDKDGNNPFPRIVTNEFYTTDGVVKGGKFYPKDGGKTYDVEVESVDVTPGGSFGSFINCVRSRDRKKVNGEILDAHYSSALCHLGNISYRLGHQVPFGTKPKEFLASDVLSDSMMTVLENTKAIGVDPEKNMYCLGPKLDFDPEKERFVNNPAADMLLTRPYRRPFVVPEKV